MNLATITNNAATKDFCLSCIYRLFASKFTLADEFFSSAVAGGLHDSCKFENERLLKLVDDLDFSPKVGGYVARGKLEYKPELVEHPLLLAQLTERSEQYLSLFRCVNFLILRRR